MFETNNYISPNKFLNIYLIPLIFNLIIETFFSSFKKGNCNVTVIFDF